MRVDEDGKEKCRALTQAGKPCRAWAQRGSRERYGRALCHVHGRAERAGTRVPVGARAPVDADAPVGTEAAGNASGEIVVRSSTELAVGDRQWRALYGPSFDRAEVAALEALIEAAEGESLNAEVEAARVILRRLLMYMTGEGTATETARLAQVALEAARTVGRLLRDKQVLAVEEEDEWQVAIGMVLDELGEEWGIQL